MNFQLLCKGKKSKIGHIRSLLAVSLVAEIGCLRQLRLKPEIFIQNNLSDSFDGPYKLEIGDVRNPLFHSLKFPKILTADYSDDSREVFCFPNEKETLYLDLDWLNSIKDRSLSFLNIFKFKIEMDSDNVSELRRMIT